MDTLKVHSQTITLVDQVEDKLLNYLKEIVFSSNFALRFKSVGKGREWVLQQ